LKARAFDKDIRSIACSYLSILHHSPAIKQINQPDC
jgi:hypothetical protein